MPDAVQFEVTDHERRQLREMMAHPGHRVHRKIVEAFLDEYRAAAVAISQTDPLSNQQQIATAWAYVVVTEGVLDRIQRGIKFELDQLDRNSRPRPTAEEDQQAHISRVLGNLD